MTMAPQHRHIPDGRRREEDTTSSLRTRFTEGERKMTVSSRKNISSPQHDELVISSTGSVLHHVLLIMSTTHHSSFPTHVQITAIIFLAYAEHMNAVVGNFVFK
ncbi:hypothetical protein KP509_28G051600 [Ceratopteris richardii]|uniref:Uncharacterized protein n=1 Tax=Ceratopteris richardii TaxID=49495 RepID=A0A8T2RC64_CERRI|nr:hypothetical protein KP509_28G051600 [Ceratopteris richardii]